MSNLYQPPLTPGFNSYGGSAAGMGNHAPTKNPYFTVGSQFLPRNLHDVIRWARYIAIQSPVTSEVIRKLSTYPITEFTYEKKDAALRAKYDKIVKSFRLRNTLHDIGFQYHTVGNVFVSIYFPIHRSFQCKNCGTVFNANKAEFLTFKNYEFIGKCPVPSCEATGPFVRKDTKSMDINQMNLIIWDPVNIIVDHNPISGKSEYYYTIPNEIKKKIQLGNRLFLNSIPWEFVEAVKNKQDVKFEDDSIFHIRNIDMGFSINGVAVPPLITHFNLVFYQATLRKANESIATDFMAPLRVVFPQAQTANSDPVTSISMRNFASNMEQAFIRHKQDNNHVLFAPVPVGYEAISGEGKSLLINAEIQQAEESLMLSMGVSRELLSGTTNWTSSTVGLRMLKNTLDSYVTQVEEFLDWVFSKTSTYLEIEYVEVGLSPFQLTDDESLKVLLTNLVQLGKVSMTTLYEAMGRSWEEEAERIKSDAIRDAELAIKTDFETRQAQFLAALEIDDMNKDDDSYKVALEQANQMAEEIVHMQPDMQRQVMNALEIQDFAKFVLVGRKLEEIQLGEDQSLARGQGPNDPNAPPGGQETGPDGNPAVGSSDPAAKKPSKKPGGAGGDGPPGAGMNQPPIEMPEKPMRPGISPIANPFHNAPGDAKKR